MHNLEDIHIEQRFSTDKTNDINITNNTFSGTNTSILIRKDSVADNISIDNNTFIKTNYVIVVVSIGNYLITNNYFSDNKHCVIQELRPRSLNLLYFTVYHNVFLNNKQLFNYYINTIHNDFINNNQYYTGNDNEVGNFYYPYLTTMHDLNFDNISDTCLIINQLYIYDC